MAKGGFKGGGYGGGGGFKGGGSAGGGGMNMNLVKRMQADMLKMQEEVEQQLFSASAGGGVVTASVNGKKELVSVKIEPDAVDPNDVEMLEDLILAAVKNAQEKVKEASDSAFGGMNLPGMSM